MIPYDDNEDMNEISINYYYFIIVVAHIFWTMMIRVVYTQFIFIMHNILCGWIIKHSWCCTECLKENCDSSNNEYILDDFRIILYCKYAKEIR